MLSSTALEVICRSLFLIGSKINSLSCASRTLREVTDSFQIMVLLMGSSDWGETERKKVKLHRYMLHFHPETREAF